MLWAVSLSPVGAPLPVLVAGWTALVAGVFGLARLALLSD